MTDDDVTKALKKARKDMKRAKTALESVWFDKTGMNDHEYDVAQDVESFALEAVESIERGLGKLGGVL